MGLIKVKTKFISLRSIGAALLLIGGLAVLASLFILIFGGKAKADFVKAQPVNKGVKYINTYEYSVDGETFKYTERVSTDDVAQPGDTVTVRYLPFLPGITFNSRALLLGAMTAVIGAAAFISGKQKE